MSPHRDPGARAIELIERLELAPHPEGGHYRRVHLARSDGRARPAQSAIHYLLRAGEFSRWHSIDADEVWNHVEGDPLELMVFQPSAGSVEIRRLGRADTVTQAAPLLAVPAGAWQTARPLGDYALVNCCVAPAFEFRGFRLLQAAPEVRAELATLAPALLRFA